MVHRRPMHALSRASLPWKERSFHKGCASSTTGRMKLCFHVKGSGNCREVIPCPPGGELIVRQWEAGAWHKTLGRRAFKLGGGSIEPPG